MKKLLCILVALVLVTMAVSAADKVVYYGNSSSDVAYTIRGNGVYRGNSSSDKVYTIDGNRIYYGNSSSDVAFTIR